MFTCLTTCHAIQYIHYLLGVSGPGPAHEGFILRPAKAPGNPPPRRSRAAAMIASRARHLLLRVRPANHGILLRGPTSHASAPGCGVGAQQRHYNHLHQQLQQQQEEEDDREESKAVKVTVWWDFERCRLPRGANPRHLAPRVTEALRRAGIRGPVEITAFGNVACIPPAEQEALADTGVALSHVPSSCVVRLLPLLLFPIS